ncbi:hypothetical protein A4R26_08915 [Niastella populi]|uniref:Uncharacterized protein n=1 Tax=Niastella populi TaxID=550983 RepID=A0A1V9EHL0_9BACT|nr:hypothetical protein A4R26_08915 [Niastella populi]
MDNWPCLFSFAGTCKTKLTANNNRYLLLPGYIKITPYKLHLLFEKAKNPERACVKPGMNDIIHVSTMCQTYVFHW